MGTHEDLFACKIMVGNLQSVSSPWLKIYLTIYLYSSTLSSFGMWKLSIYTAVVLASVANK